MSTSIEMRAGVQLGTGAGTGGDEQRLNVLVQSWSAAVARTSFVSGGRARVREVLAESLRRLAAALIAEPFDALPGYRVGFELVAAQINSPQALGRTITLLDRQLIPALGISDKQAPERLAALLGQLATGVTEATRNVAVASVEDINRAERAAWRAKQTESDRRLQQALLSERLTGLPNRAGLAGRLDEILTDPPSCTRIGVCVINLDRFKTVNDILGHDKGDRLLRAVAMRLRHLADCSNFYLAHLGADEFAIVVEHTTGEETMNKVTDLVLRTLREPFSLDGHHIPVTASAGIVEEATTSACPAELLRNADIALGWAKTHHRGEWASFDPDRYASQVHRHAVAAAMPAALSADDFTLAYQPLIRLADCRMVGVEALARWHHPDHGNIGPAEFIPLAENTGLIEPLGLRLLEKACNDAVGWSSHTHSPFMVSVNLSVAQLRTPGLVAAIASILHRTGLSADRLQLEITESAIINTGDDTKQTLHSLANNGIRLAIDDFGTGYSCLAYLADLPVHAIKLAPGFLHGLDETDTKHSNGTILPAALIALGHDLDLTVTAEGIETSAQTRHLTALNCDFGQGFYLGHPTTAERITQLLGA